jgi:hypothetical protein
MSAAGTIRDGWPYASAELLARHSDGPRHLRLERGLAMTLHVGRSWTGTAIEDDCPCPKAPCGLVDGSDVHPACLHHPFQRAKTFRQIHPADRCPELSDGAWADMQLKNLDPVIAYMEETEEDAWRVDTVRSADGATNCFFGHLFNMGGNDARGNELWNGFENAWASTFMLFSINDGTDRRYLQETPKQRVLAYLRDLNSGAAKTTPQLMEEDYNYWLAGQKELGTRTI